MKRTLFSLAIVVCTAVFFAGPQAANAEFIGDTKDSADFNWNYEMDADPCAQDLDTNAGNDWAFMRGGLTVNGDGTITLPFNSSDNYYGTIISAYGEGTTWDRDGSVWRNITDASGYTVEIRMKSAGADVWNTYTGGTYIVVNDDSSDKYSALVPVNEKTLWDQAARTIIDDNANDDDFHTFRIAQKASDDTYYVWRDGELISEDVGKQSSGQTWNRLQIGDMAGAAGPIVVDYIRIIPGAYAPVPEPSTLTLLAAGLVGLLAYAWRKRR
ncbi:MAG: PEP-CTERM sorting domain-containing protein [Pirellulales bacterium]|nr:PEP-CTERM sorting domain-containing protein [Pirellulales bacterium]